MNWLKKLFLNGRERELLERGILPTPDMLDVLERGRMLTPAEKTLLDAPRETVLRAMLSSEQWAVVSALEKPDTFLRDVAFEKTEADALEQFFKSPLWAKVDVAIINWLQQQAQQAIAAEPAQMIAAGKFAHGCRAGFEMTKSISRLAAAHRSEPEEDAPTAAAGLAQHQP